MPPYHNNPKARTGISILQNPKAMSLSAESQTPRAQQSTVSRGPLMPGQDHRFAIPAKGPLCRGRVIAGLTKTQKRLL